MSKQQEVHPFEYGNIALSEVVHIDGTPHVTGPAIGEWLEYTNPRVSIGNIITRNPHLEEFSTVIKLVTVDGKKRDVRVYHPMGFLLTVMESGQPKAIEKKVEVAHFVWDHVNPERMRPVDKARMIGVMVTLLDRLERTVDAFNRKLLLGQLRAVCYELGQPVPDESMIGKDYRQLDIGGI